MSVRNTRETLNLENSVGALREQARAARQSIENSMRNLGNDPDAVSTAESALSNIAALEAQLDGGGMSRADLTNATRLLSALQFAATTLANASSTSPKSSVDEALNATSARTRATVQGLSEDLFERKIFDPYLQFASEEDERAYRQREEERQEYIRREMAKGTPEGTLNASAATYGQVLDAGAHGADRSPEYAQKHDVAAAAFGNLRNATTAAGHPTTEADARLTADVRTTLRARGLSESEIDTRVAASSNPADALREATPSPLPETAPANELVDVAAALRAAGVTPPPDSAGPGHGLVATAQPAPGRGLG